MIAPQPPAPEAALPRIVACVAEYARDDLEPIAALAAGRVAVQAFDILEVVAGDSAQLQGDLETASGLILAGTHSRDAGDELKLLAELEGMSIPRLRLVPGGCLAPYLTGSDYEARGWPTADKPHVVVSSPLDLRNDIAVSRIKGWLGFVTNRPG